MYYIGKMSKKQEKWDEKASGMLLSGCLFVYLTITLSYYLFMPCNGDGLQNEYGKITDDPKGKWKAISCCGVSKDSSHTGGNHKNRNGNQQENTQKGIENGVYFFPGLMEGQKCIYQIEDRTQ
jgi:hypothetical protein